MKKGLFGVSVGGTGRCTLLLSTLAMASFLCSLPNKGYIKKFRAESWRLLAGTKASNACQGAALHKWLIDECATLKVQFYVDVGSSGSSSSSSDNNACLPSEAFLPEASLPAQSGMGNTLHC